jgi:hypothetical protein
VLAGGEDRCFLPDVLSPDPPVLLHEVGHREVDAAELDARQRRVAGIFRAARQEDGVVPVDEIRERRRHADIGAVVEGHALNLHLAHPTLDVVLLHLEVGNTIAEQTTGPRLPLEHMDIVADACELLGRRHPRRPGSDDGDALAGLLRGDLRLHPAHCPRLVGDRLLDRLDGDRHVLEIEGAGLLAGRGADAAGELREIIGGVEVARRLLPVVLVDEIVPVGDLIVDGAAGRAMAIGNAAIHAARGLARYVLLVERQRELPEMPDAIGRRQVLLVLPVDLEKPRRLTHLNPLRNPGLASARAGIALQKERASSDPVTPAERSESRNRPPERAPIRNCPAWAALSDGGPGFLFARPG